MDVSIFQPDINMKKEKKSHHLLLGNVCQPGFLRLKNEMRKRIFSKFHHLAERYSTQFDVERT